MRSATRWAAVTATLLVLAGGASSYADDAPAPAPAPAPAASPAPAPGFSAVGSWQLLAKVNAHRNALGLRPLVVDSQLAAAARSWTERMVAAETLAHNEPLFSRASHRALRMSALGENVGWNYSVTAQDAAFLHSPLHRANVETASFRSAGFAVVRGADGRIWSTEDFGTPAS
jgi:uncharacterized protein YkwD